MSINIAPGVRARRSNDPLVPRPGYPVLRCTARTRDARLSRTELGGCRFHETVPRTRFDLHRAKESMFEHSSTITNHRIIESNLRRCSKRARNEYGSSRVFRPRGEIGSIRRNFPGIVFAFERGTVNRFASRCDTPPKRIVHLERRIQSI